MTIREYKNKNSRKRFKELLKKFELDSIDGLCLPIERKKQMRRMKPKYELVLTQSERARLNAVRGGNFSKRIINRAEILLRIDDGETYRNISQIMDGVSQNTISNTLRRFFEGGIDYVIVARNNLP